MFPSSHLQYRNRPTVFVPMQQPASGMAGGGNSSSDALYEQKVANVLKARYRGSVAFERCSGALIPPHLRERDIFSKRVVRGARMVLETATYTEDRALRVTVGSADLWFQLPARTSHEDIDALSPRQMSDDRYFLLQAAATVINVHCRHTDAHLATDIQIEALRQEVEKYAADAVVVEAIDDARPINYSNAIDDSDVESDSESAACSDALEKSDIRGSGDAALAEKMIGNERYYSDISDAESEPDHTPAKQLYVYTPCVSILTARPGENPPAMLTAVPAPINRIVPEAQDSPGALLYPAATHAPRLRTGKNAGAGGVSLLERPRAAKRQPAGGISLLAKPY